MDNKDVFARNLREYMQIKKKSRREVCDDLGFSYYTFSDWVNGKKYPRMDKVEMLANYFGIQKSDLIEEKPPEEQQKKPDADEGLSDNMRELMDFVRTVPEDKAAMILSVIRTIVEAGK